MKVAATERLETGERVELAQLEKVIERGAKTFLEVGRALAAIRDSKLYREGFKTFEAYCSERWGYEKRYSHYLANASETAVRIQQIAESKPDLGTIVHKLCESEGRLRELADVSDKDLPKVLRKLAKSDEPVTAKAIKKAVSEVLPPPEPERKVAEAAPPESKTDHVPLSEPEPPKREELLDGEKKPVPPNLVAAFAARDEIFAIADALDAVHERLKRLAAAGRAGLDILNTAMKKFTTGTDQPSYEMAELTAVAKMLRTTYAPHAVCPVDGADPSRECDNCFGKGWSNRDDYRDWMRRARRDAKGTGARASA